jgi:hypothetical protein
MSDEAKIPDLKQHIDACIKMNSIPLLIQSLSGYTALEQNRTVFLEEIKKEVAKDILLIKKNTNQNDRFIALVLIDPVSKKILLKVRYIFLIVILKYSIK